MIRMMIGTKVYLQCITELDGIKIKADTTEEGPVAQVEYSR
jgi:hypothetical protein